MTNIKNIKYYFYLILIFYLCFLIGCSTIESLPLVKLYDTIGSVYSVWTGDVSNDVSNDSTEKIKDNENGESQKHSEDSINNKQ